MLTSALPAGQWALKDIDLPKAAIHLDLINLMCYDFAGPWTDLSGHHAQLYTPRNPHNDAARTSGDSAVKYLISKGVSPRKILLGIPAYGRSFLGATGIGCPYQGQGGEEGTFEYRNLAPTFEFEEKAISSYSISGGEAGPSEYKRLAPARGIQFDEEAVAAYSISEAGGFVTFDNPRAVRMKGSYVKEHSLGGLFYWTGTGDSNDSQSLVEAGYRALRSC